MRNFSLIMLAILLLAFSGPVAAHTPPPAPPEPARLDAARSFVRSLPIAQVALQRFPEAALRSELLQALVERAMGLEAGSGTDEVAYLVRNGVNAGIDRHLTAILPAASEEMAVGYAGMFTIAELDAATRFFASTEGRKMAGRFASMDPVVGYSLRPFLYRALEPELQTILAAAKAGERLRRQINAR